MRQVTSILLATLGAALITWCALMAGATNIHCPEFGPDDREWISSGTSRMCWGSVPGAEKYYIYRDGSDIPFALTSHNIVTTPCQGTAARETYTIAAVSSSGDVGLRSLPITVNCGCGFDFDCNGVVNVHDMDPFVRAFLGEWKLPIRYE